MNKSILLLLLLSSLNFTNITKGSTNEIQQQDPVTFKMLCLKEQLLKLIEEAERAESISKYLKSKGLDKYFGIEEQAEVTKICKNLGIKDEWLYAVIWFESRGNPQAINKYSNATGIIQFMPKTAQNLGTTVNNLYNMTVVEQLQYVEKYLKKWDDKYDLNTYLDTYLAVFYPAALGKTKDFVIGTGKLVQQNKNVDANKDGTITVADFMAYAKV
jgi:hypothetical protein